VRSLAQRPHAASFSARCETDALLIACNRGRPASQICVVGAVITPAVMTVEHNIKCFFLLLAYPLSCKTDVVK